MRHKQNLIGKTFGKLTVIDEAPYSKNKNDPSPYWKCRCECGNETNVRAYTLTNGITKTCGGVHHRTGVEHYRWKGCGQMSGRYFCEVKKSAKARNFLFRITREDMWEQFVKQNEKCALTGVPLTFESKYQGTASLDRIDSTKGYVKGNIQWVHKKVNMFKKDYPQKQFLQLCKSISDYVFNQIPSTTLDFL